MLYFNDSVAVVVAMAVADDYETYRQSDDCVKCTIVLLLLRITKTDRETG